MRAISLRATLVAAACAHGALASALFGLHGPAAMRHPEDPLDALFLVTEEPEVPPTALAPASEQGAASLPSPGSMSRGTTPALAPEEQVQRHDAEIAPAASGEPWSFRGGAPSLALGADGYWKSVALAGGSASAHPEPPPERAPMTPSPDRILRDGLDARDRELGLGSAGPLISAAHEAASPSIAPDTGAATLEIDCDASGRVVSARVVSTGAESAKWNAVARELVRIASAKTVRVPPGARGVRTRLRILAERSLPSGSKVTPSPGAVPDDVAGGPGGTKACEGEGASRRCVAGMPAGVTGNVGDLANIGARASRIVRVMVVGEETL